MASQFEQKDSGERGVPGRGDYVIWRSWINSSSMGGRSGSDGRAVSVALSPTAGSSAKRIG